MEGTGLGSGGEGSSKVTEFYFSLNATIQPSDIFVAAIVTIE